MVCSPCWYPVDQMREPVSAGQEWKGYSTFRNQLEASSTSTYHEIWHRRLFFNLCEYITSPCEALDQRFEKLTVETQLAGVRQLFKLDILDAQQLHL